MFVVCLAPLMHFRAAGSNALQNCTKPWPRNTVPNHPGECELYVLRRLLDVSVPSTIPAGCLYEEISTVLFTGLELLADVRLHAESTRFVALPLCGAHLREEQPNKSARTGPITRVILVHLPNCNGGESNA